MADKHIPASKLGELPRYFLDARETIRTQHAILIPSEHGEILLVKELLALIEDEPEVSDEPVGDWLWGKLMDWCKTRRVAPANHNDLFAIVGLAREKFGAAAIKTPPSQDQTALIRDLKKALENMRELITNDYKTEEYLDDLLFQAEKAIK